MIIRRFTPADVPFAHELRALAGWNQSEQDWNGYVRFEPAGCFVAEIEGKPAGTAITIRYGDAVGWIGMVLVHPDQRRLGIGTKLLQHAIDYLQRCGVRSIKLDATPMGRKVYVPLGFVDEYEVTRFEGNLRPIANGARKAELLTALDFDELVRFDAEAFGVERRQVLTELTARQPSWCFAVREDEGLRGFLIAREGANAVQVGPWVARDTETAEALLNALATAGAGERMCFVDVPAPSAGGTALMQRLGFRVQRNFTRMYLGENPQPGRPDFIYSTSGAEKG